VKSASIRAYFRTPKGLLVLLLLALIAVAYPVEGQAALLRVGLAAASAVAVDALLMNIRGKLEFPDSAVLTGLIVAMVLGPVVPLGVPILASALAVTSKHLLRTRRGGHIFNPAALGLLIAGLLFSSEQSWWGGLGDLPPGFIVLVAAAGLMVANRVNKVPSVLAFLGVYVVLLTVGSLAGSPLSFADAFREPMTGAALYFASFMLTDPPTTPARVNDQVWFAIVVAIVSAVCLTLNWGGVYYLLIGLLAGNGFEAARRAISGRRKPAPRPMAEGRPRLPSIALG